jgi:hypothetical protein
MTDAKLRERAGSLLQWLALQWASDVDGVDDLTAQVQIEKCLREARAEAIEECATAVESVRQGATSIPRYVVIERIRALKETVR